MKNKKLGRAAIAVIAALLILLLGVAAMLLCGTRGAWEDIVAIDAEGEHVIALCSDGRVRTTLYYSEKDENGKTIKFYESTEGWSGIAAVAAGTDHVVGLKTDGTVIAAGDNKKGCCDVTDWTDVSLIAAGKDFTVGIKKDGSFLTAGNIKAGELAGWTDITDIDAYGYGIVGLKSDGTVISNVSELTFDEEGNPIGERSVCDGMKDIAQASVCGDNIAGLKADGMVCFAEGADSDIDGAVFIDADEYGAVAVKADGSVVGIDGWSDIQKLANGDGFTVGLKSDGTLISTNDKDSGIFRGRKVYELIF